MKLLESLESSAVDPAFAAALHDFLAIGRANERIAFTAGSPPVKVERTLIKLLEEHATMPIESIRISSRSGCEFFRGEISIQAKDQQLQVRFHWDCRWRAQEQGWTDYFGLPDQIRAAREFGYDCFREWEVRTTPADAAA